LAETLVEEAAEAATRIINRMVDVGAPAVTLIGGLAEPLSSWLPADVRRFICEPRSDPLAGAILMARQTFFGLESVQSVAS
jgi:glucosamine kinase